MLAAGRKLTYCTTSKLTSRTSSMVPCASSTPPGPNNNGDAPKASPSPASALNFLLLASNLKTNKRTGWVLRNVHGPESIADHMYRMSLMSLIAGDTGVDQNRCIKMSIVHDVAEAIVGDITPHCKISKEEKKRLEENAIIQMEQMLGAGTAAANEVGTLWREYEAAQTPEAQWVKDLDKLEMIMQAYEYETAQPDLNLQEFFDATENVFKTPLGKAWADELRARRKSKKQGDGTADDKS
ncbi:HD domain-containing protein [Dunaliella salina]|uniref:HD domain-containing protein n=1 Tax=Dunaliella salina TaxID=3046 RepID=A0ABQ7FYQ7_DUNSA|nr:HD domain-containing protein [Dunaliella salina]|eukprot:KAF5827434.1 HD domain-containing protein [Dunaliella salina]